MRCDRFGIDFGPCWGSIVEPFRTVLGSMWEPFWSPKRSKVELGSDLAANIDFGAFPDRKRSGPKNFGPALGGLLAASWRLPGGQEGVKWAPKSIFGGPGWRSNTNMILDTFLDRFWIDFGAIWGSKMEPKSLLKRCQERSCSESKNLSKTL